VYTLSVELDEGSSKVASEELKIMSKLCVSSRSQRRARIAGAATVGLALVVLIFAALSCGGGTSNGSESSTTASSSAGGSAQVVMKDIAFDPQTITVNAGDSVTWTNEDSVSHTVVADNGEFESGQLGQGETFSFTFASVGTYPYTCTIHPGMKGTVIVQ
jgi:plastocyanin